MIKLNLKKAVNVALLKLVEKEEIESFIIGSSYEAWYSGVLYAIKTTDHLLKTQGYTNRNDFGIFKEFLRTFKKLPEYYFIDESMDISIFECYLEDGLYQHWLFKFEGYAFGDTLGWDRDYEAFVRKQIITKY